MERVLYRVGWSCQLVRHETIRLMAERERDQAGLYGSAGHGHECCTCMSDYLSELDCFLVKTQSFVDLVLELDDAVQ